MITHIRRTDEINLTECGRLTEFDVIVTNDPVRVGSRGVAIFPDVEWPAGTSHCRACVRAYEAVQ